MLFAQFWFLYVPFYKCGAFSFSLVPSVTFVVQQKLSHNIDLIQSLLPSAFKNKKTDFREDKQILMFFLMDTLQLIYDWWWFICTIIVFKVLNQPQSFIDISHLCEPDTQSVSSVTSGSQVDLLNVPQSADERCSAHSNIHWTQASVSNGSRCRVEVDGVNNWG